MSYYRLCEHDRVPILERLLIAQARQLWLAVVCTPSNAESVQAARYATKTPLPGDFVMDHGSIHQPDTARIGRLIRSCWEPFPLAIGDDPAEDRAVEVITYIETLDGRCIRWRDTSFMRLFPSEFDPVVDPKAAHLWALGAARHHGLPVEWTPAPTPT